MQFLHHPNDVHCTPTVYTKAILELEFGYSHLLAESPSVRAGWPVCAWPTYSGRWAAGLDSTTFTLGGMLLDLNGQLDGATWLSSQRSAGPCLVVPSWGLLWPWMDQRPVEDP